MINLEKEIKKELLGKIALLSKCERRLFEIAEEYPELEASDEFLELESRYCSLQNEIDELLIETKYLPLCALSFKQIKSIPKGPTFSTRAGIFTVCTKNIKRAVNEEIIENHLDFRLKSLKEEMKTRLGKIKSLYLTIDINLRTYHFYKEVIRCYIYGAFEASCILCRAIVEDIAKRFIEYKGYGDLLVGKETQLKKLTVLGILTEKLSIQKEVIEIYTKIARKADRILHAKSEKVEEKDALESIKLLQSFIKRFPKTL